MMRTSMIRTVLRVGESVGENGLHQLRETFDYILLGIGKKVLSNSIRILRILKEQLAKSDGEPASSSASVRNFYRSIDGAYVIASFVGLLARVFRVLAWIEPERDCSAGLWLARS